MTYIAIAFFLLIGAFASIKYSNKEEKKTSKVDNSHSISSNQQDQYLDLRNMALTASTENLGLKNIDNNKVFGIVTDMAMQNGTATVVAFLTGDTSLYLSSGGAYIGAGNHEDVNHKIREIVEGLQKYKNQGNPIEFAELPTSDQIKFNLLTKDGMYQITASGEEIMSGSSEYLDLYKEVDKIMTLIRLKSEE